MLVFVLQAVHAGSPWQARYLQHLLRPVATEIPDIRAPVDAVAAMQQELESVAEVVQHSVSATTLGRRHSIWGEFSAFMYAYGQDVDDAEPADVCRFLDSYYPHEHAGTLMPGGSVVAAPHALQNARSLLSAVFRQQGRSQAWRDQDRSGNPCDSTLVVQSLTGYSKI